MLPEIAPLAGTSTSPGAADGVLAVLRGDRLAVMLFGSHARGDAHADSDIDILQLVERWRPSYAIGRLSISVYTYDHLLALSRAGSLFVLHLAAEGRSLEDHSQRLRRVLEAYRAPASYTRARTNLRRASSVLAVDRVGFQRNPTGFLRVAFYLLRTALYVRCVELGPPVFAMRQVALRLRRPEITEIFERRGRTTFDAFEEVRSLVYREVGADGINEFGSLEALSVGLHVACPIASRLALRLLAGSERVEYDSTLFDWSHDE
ncbi:MAG TPA: nucleotidyltransferase domain-containing protein [Kofleriaceae bacterium]|jgi:predicted nucleotidyltransferase